MLQPVLLSKIEQYKTIYSSLHSELKWKVDKRSLMLIAAMYVTSNREFQVKRLLEMADFIKNEVGFFSQLNSVTRFTTAATLDTQSSDPKVAFQHYVSIYKKLIEGGFSRTIFTYIAAGTMVKVEPSRVDEYVTKASKIYKGMREHHFFLTSYEDYPLAACLACSEVHEDMLIATIEEFYQALNQRGFSKGNDLQFLSHILTLDPGKRPGESADQCLKIKELLSGINIKSKRPYYPYIGMLTFLDKPENEIKNLNEIYEQLNNEKQFKWNKDINFMISVLFLLNQSAQIGDAAQTSLNTTIEIFIQAQQAAMTASIIATTSAANSSSSS